MGLFSPNQDKQAATAQPVPAPLQVPIPNGAKTAPTPKRRDAEAARRQRVNPQLSPKDAKRKARMDATVERRKRAEALDSTPGKVLMRSWVDTRFNLAEWSMPILMTLLLLVLVVSPAYPPIVEPTTYGTWAFIIFIAVDIFVMWHGFKKLAARRIPGEPLKGLLYYGFNRSLTMRRMRIPRPVAKRGDTI